MTTKKLPTKVIDQLDRLNKSVDQQLQQIAPELTREKVLQAYNLLGQERAAEINLVSGYALGADLPDDYTFNRDDRTVSYPEAENANGLHPVD